MEIIYGFPFIHESEKMHMVFINMTWFPKPWTKDKERKICFWNAKWLRSFLAHGFLQGCDFLKTKDTNWFKETNSKL